MLLAACAGKTDNGKDTTQDTTTAADTTTANNGGDKDPEPASVTLNVGSYNVKHFALLNKTKAFLTFAGSDSTEYELKTLNKVLKTYKAKSIIISDVYEDYGCDILVKFEKGRSRLATIINKIILIQLLALKIAKKLGRNIDKPQGLVKVVEDKG